MAEPTLPAQLRQRDQLRLRTYAEYLKFYDGDQWIATERRRHRRLTLNYVRAIVQKTTSYLMKGRTVVVDPDNDSDQAAELASMVETALAQVWDTNQLDALDFDTELDAAVLGDGAYKVRWDNTDKLVRVSAPDAAGLFAWLWPGDTTRTYRVAHRFDLDPDAARVAYPTAAPKLLRKTNTIIEDWTADQFDIWLNDTIIITAPNPYGFIPFVIFPNVREPKQLWGSSDIKPLMDAQRDLNRATTQLSRILELSGNPIAVLENITEAQDIAVEPGEVWEIPKDAKAYLLDLLARGGVRLHVDYITHVLYRALHDLGEVPASAFGGTTRNLSGVALELELDPIVKKVERKRLIRTPAYRRRNDMILALLDRFAKTTFGAPNHTIAWGTILPTDRDRQVSNEVSMVTAGIHSRHHAADALGAVDNPDAEFDRWLQEQTDLQRANSAFPRTVR